ncbi:MAG: DUF86 domain-containing protein [Syntrophales bacterium]
MVDRNLILRKISELEEYSGQIREFSDISVEQYALDWKVQRIVERTLQMMIELCVDIANHIISDKNLRVPVTYADTFRVLFENDLIDKPLYETMDKMAKFRNIVVHDYDKIDQTIVVSILRKHLDSFLVFRDRILQVLSSS